MEYAESKMIRRLNALVMLKVAQNYPFQLVFEYFDLFLQIIVPEVKMYVFIMTTRAKSTQNGNNLNIGNQRSTK